MCESLHGGEVFASVRQGVVDDMLRSFPCGEVRSA